MEKEKRMLVKDGKGYFLADVFVEHVDTLVKFVGRAESLAVASIVLAVVAIILAILL